MISKTSDGTRSFASNAVRHWTVTTSRSTQTRRPSASTPCSLLLFSHSDAARLLTTYRYETVCLCAAVSNEEDFVWCRAGCGSGQVHAAGRHQPIVTCIQCNHRFCFVHKVTWHEGMTCSDYDEFRADPQNFKSRVQRENEALAKAERIARRRREALEEADRMLAQVSHGAPCPLC